MTFLGLPAAQLLPLFGAGAAGLTLLYVLKQRRRRVEVPFARLWQRVLRETESTSLWQHLKRWLSLLLQIVTLGLLVLALADPRLGPSLSGQTLVLLIDASASMQARNPDGTTRIAQARKEARRLVHDLAGDDLAVVVSLDGQPAPMGGLSQDERELAAQVDAVVARDEPADLPRALRLAGDLLFGRKNPQVVLISDGGFDEATLAGLPAAAALDLRFVPLPAALLPPAQSPGGNVAITAFAVRRYRHNRLSYEVLVELAAFPDVMAGEAPPAGPRPTQVALELLQEGETVDVQKLSLLPGERVQRLYPNLSGSGAHLTARLRVLDGKDVLPLDDEAYAVLPERRYQRVLVVTRGNLFLEGALLSASAGEETQLKIDKIAPAAYDPAAAARHDAVIFDGFTPPVPPERSALYLDPQGPGSPLPITETLDRPLVSDTAKDHPLLRWVTLKDLNVSRASVFQLEAGDVAVASMLRKPLIAARERGGPGGLLRTVAVGFDLRHSDLPLRVAFPVFLVNTLDWFAGEVSGDTEIYTTGHTWRIPLLSRGSAPGGPVPGRAAEAAGVRITLPDGTSAPLPVQEGYALYHGQRVGFHEVSQGGGPPLLLAANLADATESAARLRRELRVGPPGGHGRLLPPPDLHRSAVKRVLWPYLLLLVLGILCLEWWSYHRRWTV